MSQFADNDIRRIEARDFAIRTDQPPRWHRMVALVDRGKAARREWAAHRNVVGIRHSARNCRQPPAWPRDRGQRIQQPACVRMRRCGEQLRRPRLLHDLARLHDTNAVAQFAYYAEVVADQH